VFIRRSTRWATTSFRRTLVRLKFVVPTAQKLVKDGFRRTLVRLKFESDHSNPWDEIVSDELS